MKSFTASEKIVHADVDGLLRIEPGETRELRDDLAVLFCGNGWGTAPGCETREPNRGRVVLKLK